MTECNSSLLLMRPDEFPIYAADGRAMKVSPKTSRSDRYPGTACTSAIIHGGRCCSVQYRARCLRRTAGMSLCHNFYRPQQPAERPFTQQRTGYPVRVSRLTMHNGRMSALELPTQQEWLQMRAALRHMSSPPLRRDRLSISDLCRADARSEFEIVDMNCRSYLAFRCAKAA